MNVPLTSWYQLLIRDQELLLRDQGRRLRLATGLLAMSPPRPGTWVHDTGMNLYCPDSATRRTSVSNSGDFR